MDKTKIDVRSLVGQTLKRDVTVDSSSVNQEDRTVDISFSSELPVQQYYNIGLVYEILSHDDGAVDLSRANDKGALLFNHNPDNLIGSIQSANIEDKRGKALVRFSESELGDEKYKQVIEGTLTHVSVGYRVKAVELTDQEIDGIPVVRVTAWEVLEISFVSIPADPSVGFGRSVTIPETKVEETKTEIINEQVNRQMADEIETIDKDTEVKVVRAEETKRIRDIEAIGQRFALTDQARSFIADGKSVEAFREYALDEVEKRSNATPVNPSKKSDTLREMETEEKRQYSLARAIAAKANGSLDGFEREVHDELTKGRAIAGGAIAIPFAALAGKRSISTSDNAGLVPNNYYGDGLIDVLRDRLVLANLGVDTSYSGLEGVIQIPNKTGTSTAYWIGEGSDITESDFDAPMIDFAPKTVGALSKISHKTLVLGSRAEEIVRKDLLDTLAHAIDKAGLVGDGSGASPTGVLNTSNVNTVSIGTNGGAVTWAKIVELESAVDSKNALVQNMNYVTNAKLRGTLKQLEKASGTAQFVWNDSNVPGVGMVNGYNAYSTNAIPSNLTKGSGTNLNAILFGDWSQLVLGSWGDYITVLINPYSYQASLAVAYTASADVNFMVRQPGAFSKIVDATA